MLVSSTRRKGSRRQYPCGAKETDWKFGREVALVCGSYYGGEMFLCTACEAAASFEYPQGWRGYPGDTCKHGVYVGGCGVDWMCAHCELGE